MGADALRQQSLLGGTLPDTPTAPVGAAFPPAAPPSAPNASTFKKIVKAVYDVLISRPIRPYEIAIAIAVLKGIEKAG